MSTIDSAQQEMPTQSEENNQVIQHRYDALGRGDTDALFASMHKGEPQERDRRVLRNSTVMNQTITHAEPSLKTVPSMITRIFEIAARADRAGVVVTRIGLIIVLLWIGGLKAFKYEAQGIVPFVANSPLMSFFYADPGQYKAHMNPEGTLVSANVEWNEKNHTGHAFAYGLGAVIVLYGLMPCLHPWLPQVAAPGGFLSIRNVACDALLSRHDAGVLGASARRRKPRLSLLERGRTAGNQGCYNDGRCSGRDGRFG